MPGPQVRSGIIFEKNLNLKKCFFQRQGENDALFARVQPLLKILVVADRPFINFFLSVSARFIDSRRPGYFLTKKNFYEFLRNKLAFYPFTL